MPLIKQLEYLCLHLSRCVSKKKNGTENTSKKFVYFEEKMSVIELELNPAVEIDSVDDRWVYYTDTDDEARKINLLGYMDQEA